MSLSLEARLDKIRSNPKLESQQQTQVVLTAVEDTLRDQKSEFTPTAYFSALLSLLGQYVEEKKGVINKDVATAVVYLLDLVTPHVPAPLLRSKFAQIIQHLSFAGSSRHAEAPLLRASIGCLEALLLAQDGQGWALSQAQISPRQAVSSLLALAVDHRPKVRKRACDALMNILKAPPPSPSLDHPAADMCAESAMVTLKVVLNASKNTKKQKESQSHTPSLIHALQLVKTIAAASGGWPSRKIDSLCELLLGVSKSSNEHLTMAAFEVFEAMFEGLADEVASAKLPHVLEIISNLQPSQSDSQLLPPWLAVISRGYDVASQVNAEETFQQLPDVFTKISTFLASASHNIRVSAAECLISFMVNCIPASIIIDPSIYDEKTLGKLAKIVTELLSVKYQSAWMEVFTVVGAMFDNLRWQSIGIMNNALKLVGDLRTHNSFTGKTEADALIAKAIRAMGPDNVLQVLPLNIGTGGDAPGRAWLLPILRDAVGNTNLAHFRSEFVPLSEKMYQRILAHGSDEKTMEIKIFETIVNQIWVTLPGYCDLPLDLSEAFDQSFAELLANLLYQQIDLRIHICRALQNLVDSNRELIAATGPEADLLKSRVSEETAQANLKFLSSFAGNFLAILFNVYTETLPQSRGPILQCINAFLSVTPENEISETFARVITSLEGSIQTEQQNKQDKTSKKPKESGPAMPPMSHTLMDLVITISIYLPRSSLSHLFNIAATMLQGDDASLQKKAYKLIPRLAECEVGQQALVERNEELQQLLLAAKDTTQASARKDRLAALATVLRSLPQSQLHFIPAIIPEVTLATKEQAEKARTFAYDLLVEMGNRMKEGGTVDQSRVAGLPSDAKKTQASIDEYFNMLSAGLLAGSPQAISASISSQTRVLHEFHAVAKESTVTDLVQTMDVFLVNTNTEIIRSVLGFVKCCILDLPQTFMAPRLRNLITAMLSYEHVHKGAVQAKVKHIMERLIRKYGFTTIEQNTPEEGKKLINNIRKTKERKKRQKAADAEDAANGEVVDTSGKQQKKFGNEYDEAMYGSDDEDAVSSEDSEVSDDELPGARRKSQAEGRRAPKTKETKGTFIVEDDDEPLDLLDKRALGKISSTRPLKQAKIPATKRKAKTDLDGKLIFNEDNNATANDTMDIDDGNATLEGGINAYVAAIKGQDAARRGQKGKLKFSNRRDRVGEGDEDIDGDEIAEKIRQLKVNKEAKGKGGVGGQRNGKTVNGIKRAKMQRKGLGAEKTREKTVGGRVGKTRGGGRPGGRR